MGMVTGSFSRWFLAAWLTFALPVNGGLFYPGTSPGTVPWPGGVIPYEFDATLTPAQQQTYLDGLREWELAANVHFVPRSNQTQYVLFKYDPFGPNLVSGSNPQTVEINLLTRGQICHEMGHSFGLQHEHIRLDRNAFVAVLSNNVSAGNLFWFDIDPAAVTNGVYDFESVMHFPRNLFSVAPATLDTLQAKPGFEKFQPRMSNFALSPGDRAALRHLYGPGPVLTNIVTTTAEGGAGSLRAALYFATDHPGTTIRFNIPISDPGYSNGVFTIRPTGYLPPLVTDGTILDGATQPGFAGKPLIVLDGSQMLPEAGSVPGLLIHAANCAVKHLSFRQFNWNGLTLLYRDATNNVIAGCWMGLDHTGASAAPNALQGIQISSGASRNIIGPGNVLSGNGQYGLWISDTNTAGNVILGNYIGTDATGSTAVPNNFSGVILTGDTRSNVVGSATAGMGNVLSGNAQYGIWISGSNTTDNVVLGNNIGTAATGASALPNQSTGVILTDRAQNNVIGGGPGARNIISGNATYGLIIVGDGTDRNRVQGNTVGLSADGLGAVPNPWAGIAIWGGARSNLIGGAATGYANLIVSNGSEGVALYDAATFGNQIQGNSFLGNGWYGIGVYGGANAQRNAPTLTSATLGNGTTITGSLGSSSNATHRIEFFASPAADPLGSGEGQTFLGSTNVTTSATGTAVINSVLSAAVPAGTVVTATATDATGNTSPFSNAITVSTTDNDSDGLPDIWETATFGNLAQTGTTDLDGDGQTNAQEFKAGTNPQDAGSAARFSLLETAGADVRLSFPSVAGKTYRVEARTDMAAGSWVILADQVAGTGGTIQITDPGAATLAKRFYRIVIVP
jgi:hypothetical protein